MCGRFTLTQEGEVLLERFRLQALPPEYRPRYNIAPGQPALSIGLRAGERRASMLRWGLIPHWAKDPKIGYSLINARAESVREKPSFRVPFERRRCLIPADGFYEWRKEGRRRIPFRFVLKKRVPFAFAGLWDAWRPPGEPQSEPLYTFTILTTAANELVARVHDRMPVILAEEEAWDLWLDPEVPGEGVAHLLESFPADAMEAYEVSPVVNSARNDTPECIVPAAAGEAGDLEQT